MKRMLILVAALIILIAGVAMAQGDGNCCQGKGMGAGMQKMHRMGPGHSSMPGMQGMRGPRGMRGGRGMGPGMAMRNGGGLEHLMAMADELKLTDQQREKIRGMFVDFATERIDRQADLAKARLRLSELMRDDKANESDVNRGIDEVSQLQADLKKMQYAHHKAVMGVLTDKQREQVKEMRMNWRDRSNPDDKDDEDEMDEGPHAPQAPDQAIQPYRPRRGKI